MKSVKSEKPTEKELGKNHLARETNPNFVVARWCVSTNSILNHLARDTHIKRNLEIHREIQTHVIWILISF